jgi:hypothetical protein
MASFVQAVDQIRAFLGNRISLDDFEDWSASYIQTVHRDGDEQAQQLAHLVRSILNAFADDETDGALRMELANAVRPFAARRDVLIQNAGTSAVVLHFVRPPGHVSLIQTGNNNSDLPFLTPSVAGQTVSTLLPERIPACRAAIGSSSFDTDSAIPKVPVCALRA